MHTKSYLYLVNRKSLFNKFYIMRLVRRKRILKDCKT